MECRARGLIKQRTIKTITTQSCLLTFLLVIISKVSRCPSSNKRGNCWGVLWRGGSGGVFGGGQEEEGGGEEGFGREVWEEGRGGRSRRDVYSLQSD